MAFWDELLTTPLRRRWGPERMARYRDRRLRRLVEHAARTIPFYGRLLARHGVRPGEIRSFADLPRLPIVTRDALREAGRDAWARDVPERLAHRTSTSGSSGNPLVVLSRLRDQARFQAANHDLMFRNGWRPWHDAVTIGARGPIFRNPLARLGVARWTWVDPARPVAQWIRVLERMRPPTLAAYPSALRELCLEVRRRGGIAWRPRVLLTGGELRPPEVVPLAEEVLGRSPLDQYGAVECGRIATECRERRGHHVRVDAVHVELLRDGEPVPPGESGEVHVTSLLYPTMPFLRYRLGDLARAVDDGPCPCGLRWPRLRLEEGRGSDVIELPGGRRVPVTTLVGPVGASPGIAAYELARTGEERLVLRHTAVPGVDTGLGPILDRMRRRLPGVSVDAERVAALPRTRTGKVRRYVDERGRSGGT